MKSSLLSTNGVSPSTKDVSPSVNGVSTVALFTKRLCSTFGFAVLAAVWSANDPYKSGSHADSEYPVD